MLLCIRKGEREGKRTGKKIKILGEMVKKGEREGRKRQDGEKASREECQIEGGEGGWRENGAA